MRKPSLKKFFSVGTGHLHTFSNNAAENVEFDPENLAASAEILFFYELFQNTCENSDIASVCHTDCEPRCFDFH